MSFWLFFGYLAIFFFLSGLVSPKNVSFEKQQPLLGVLCYLHLLKINSCSVFNDFSLAHQNLCTHSSFEFPVVLWWIKSKPKLQTLTDCRKSGKSATPKIFSLSS